jgi:site-specific recombinase XerD
MFPGTVSPQIGNETFRMMLTAVQKQTVAENPDLTELPGKNLTPHSLRVSFAKLLFNGGCNIRSINELMMHNRLSTTAYYTPIPLEDLRRVCRTAHPRA